MLENKNLFSIKWKKTSVSLNIKIIAKILKFLRYIMCLITEGFCKIKVSWKVSLFQ